MEPIDELNFPIKIKQEPHESSTDEGNYFISNDFTSNAYTQDFHNNLIGYDHTMSQYHGISESTESSDEKITCEFESHDVKPEVKFSATEIFNLGIQNNFTNNKMENTVVYCEVKKEVSNIIKNEYDEDIVCEFESHDEKPQVKYSATETFNLGSQNIFANDKIENNGVDSGENLKKKIDIEHKNLNLNKYNIHHKTFQLKTNLREHLNIEHKKLKPYECELCHKIFGRKHYLESHTNNVHKQLKPYECDICHKTFGRKHRLEIHVNIVHEKLKPHECKICHKKFGEKTNLLRHVKTVHKKLKPYECGICHKTFGEKISLLRHVKGMHEELKPYECFMCRKAFGEKYHLDMHMWGM